MMKEKKNQTELSLRLYLIQVRNRQLLLLLLLQNKLVIQLTVLLHPLAREQAFGHALIVHLTHLSADILSAERAR